MTDPITQAEVEEAQALLAKATAGPWEWRENDEGDYGKMRCLSPGVLVIDRDPGCGGPWGDEIDQANAALIVLMRSMFPRLLAERREREAQCARFRNGLEEIASSHIPDQPAAAGGDDLVWAQQHVGRLRRIALNAMESNNE